MRCHIPKHSSSTLLFLTSDRDHIALIPPMYYTPCLDMVYLVIGIVINSLSVALSLLNITQ